MSNGELLNIIDGVCLAFSSSAAHLFSSRHAKKSDTRSLLGRAFNSRQGPSDHCFRPCSVVLAAAYLSRCAGITQTLLVLLLLHMQVACIF